MQRVTRSTAVAVFPAPPASPGSPGFFTGGNPGGGVPATIPGYEWFNGVQEELIAQIQVSGLAPDAADLQQLRKALSRLYGGGLRTVTANTTLTADDAGLVLVDAAGGNRTITLPAANAAGGRPIELLLIRIDSTANTVTIQRAGSDTIEGAATYPLPQGNRLALMSDGGTAWRVVHETAVGRSVNNPGWTRLPGGLLFQWVRNLTGMTNASGGATITWTFPVAFPNGVLGYTYSATNEANAVNDVRIVANAPSLTSHAVNLLAAPTSAVALSGFAIGH